MKTFVAFALLLLVLLSTLVLAQDKASARIPKGAKIFVTHTEDGFDTYLKAAMAKKKVPVVVVESREQAEYEISPVADSQKAGVAKKVLFLDWRSREEASIRVTNIKTSEVVFAYSVHKNSSNHGKQSTAEACAKHIKDNIEGQ